MRLLEKKHQLVMAFFLLLVMGWWVVSVNAQAGINPQIHFQGKVVNLNGTNVTDNTYSFTFSIYSVDTGGTAIWTETKNIVVTDGIFTTNLGSVTALPGSIDFNSNSLYVGVNFNNDGEMAPRIRLTATPYAFNAAKVAGLTVTNTTGTLTIPNGSTISFAGAFSTSGANALTLTTTGTTDVTLPTTGTLATIAGTETLTNKTLGSGSTWNGNVISSLYGGTGADLSAAAIGSLPYFSAVGVMSALAPGTSGYALVSNGTGVAPSWQEIAAGSSRWANTLSVYHPTNEFAGVVDLVLGGTSTESAKFAFMNVNSGTPTASISGNLAIAAPTGASPATTYDILNGGSFNLRTSVGGDAGLASRLFVANGGNVGIGTTDPTRALEVSGAARINYSGDDSRPGLWIDARSSALEDYAAFRIDLRATGSRKAFQIANNDETYSWASFEFNAGGTSRPGFSLGPGGVTARDVAIYREGAGIWGFSTGGTERMRINASGNVGIGVTNPSQLLHVAGGLRLTGGFYDASNAVGTSGNILTSTGSGTSWTSAFGLGSRWQNTANVYHPGNEFAGVVDLAIGGTSTTSAKFAFMNVNSGTPTASISGNLAIAAPTGASPATTYDILNGGSFNLRTSVGGDAGLASRLFVSNQGHIGIGTTIPDRSIDLFAAPADVPRMATTATMTTNPATILEFRHSSTTNLGRIAGVTAGGVDTFYLYSTAAKQLGLGAGSSSTPHLLIDTSGNVGIGVTNPGAKLTLADHTTAAGGIALGSDVTLYRSAANTLRTNDNFIVDLDLTVSGNVGIGAGNYLNWGATSGETGYGFRDNAGTMQFKNSAGAWTNFGAGGSSVWSDLTAPAANLTLGMGTFTSTFNFANTTTNAFSMNFDSMTSGNGLVLGSTSTALTTGSLLKLDWSPGTATNALGDLFSLNIGANGQIGNLFAIYNNASPVFRVSQSGITSSVPHTFAAAGDVSIAHDIVLTNSVAAYIDFDGPGYIRTNHPSANNNLTFSAANTGIVLVDDNLGVTSGASIGSTYATTVAPTGGLLVQGNVGIGSLTPSGKLDVVASATTTSTNGLRLDYTQLTDVANITGSALDITVTPSGDAGDTVRGININNITGTASTEYALVIGTGWDRGLSVASAAVFGASVTSEGTVTIGSGGNTFVFDPAAGPLYSGTARPARSLTLSPEYSGATLTAFYGAGTDTDITGTMTADVETTGTADQRTFYYWESDQVALHNYTVAIRIRLPSDFAAWATTDALQIGFATELTTAADNAVDARVYLSSDTTTAVATSADNASGTAATWSTISIDDSVLDSGVAPEWDAAGETAIIYLRMRSKDSNYVKIGDVTLNYVSRY